MRRSNGSQKERPRELRRRVVLPARLRTGASWSDTCILNISSRGLMIHSARIGSIGSLVELYRGHHVISARVVWRNGARAGLQADERVPVEDILSAEQSPALRLTAEGRPIERRQAPRVDSEKARLGGRAIEFLAVGFIILSFATGTWGLAEAAFARPLGLVTAALQSSS